MKSWLENGLLPINEFTAVWYLICLNITKNNNIFSRQKFRLAWRRYKIAKVKLKSWSYPTPYKKKWLKMNLTTFQWNIFVYSIWTTMLGKYREKTAWNWGVRWSKNPWPPGTESWPWSRTSWGTGTRNWAGTRTGSGTGTGNRRGRRIGIWS